MTGFVLLHGSWHGGWCWARVATVLRARGHAVTTPTMTGLGERRHLLAPGVDLATHRDDLVGHLRYEAPAGAVVVAHSYGGCPALGAADAAGERIAALIFLDALLIESGESVFDTLPGDAVAARRQMAADAGGLALPPPPAEAFGISDPADKAWLEPRLTPQPLASYETPLRLEAPPGAGLPAAYLPCTEPAYPATRASAERAASYGWRVEDLAACHDAMVSAPIATADAIERLAWALTRKTAPASG